MYSSKPENSISNWLHTIRLSGGQSSKSSLKIDEIISLKFWLLKFRKVQSPGLFELAVCRAMPFESFESLWPEFWVVCLTITNSALSISYLCFRHQWLKYCSYHVSTCSPCLNSRDHPWTSAADFKSTPHQSDPIKAMQKCMRRLAFAVTGPTVKKTRLWNTHNDLNIVMLPSCLYSPLHCCFSFCLVALEGRFESNSL